jgi:putative membrane protein
MKLIKLNIETFLIFLRGLFMGTADVIPGVSGGTIALITGIYERLIHAISRIDFRFILYLFEGDFKRFKQNAVQEIDFGLFVPLLLGIGLAILTMSKVISFLLANYPAVTFAFFFGLILSSAIFVYKHVDELNIKNLAFLVLGFIFAIIFVGLNPIQANHSLPVIFLSGAVAICAMILPGISGAFILLLLNQYEYMINVLNNLQIVEIVTFGAGALIGILSFSRALDYMLTNHKSVTMAFLVGLMIGTLRLPYQKIVVSMQSPVLIVAAAVIGFLVVFILERRFENKPLTSASKNK